MSKERVVFLTGEMLDRAQGCPAAAMYLANGYRKAEERLSSWVNYWFRRGARELLYPASIGMSVPQVVDLETFGEMAMSGVSPVYGGTMVESYKTRGIKSAEDAVNTIHAMLELLRQELVEGNIGVEGGSFEEVGIHNIINWVKYEFRSRTPMVFRTGDKMAVVFIEPIAKLGDEERCVEGLRHILLSGLPFSAPAHVSVAVSAVCITRSMDPKIVSAYRPLSPFDIDGAVDEFRRVCQDLADNRCTYRCISPFGESCEFYSLCIARPIDNPADLVSPIGEEDFPF